MMETIYRILSACKTMTLSFSSYIPVVFIGGILNMFFFLRRGGGLKNLSLCMYVCSLKGLNTLPT